MYTLFSFPFVHVKNSKLLTKNTTVFLVLSKHILKIALYEKMKLDDCVVRSLREISFWEDFFTPFSGFCSKKRIFLCFMLFKTTFNGFENLSQQ